MRRLVLGSASPRRLELLHGLGLTDIEVRPAGVDEPHPDHIPVSALALFLARRKSQALRSTLLPGEYLLTADTVVLLEGRVLDKPRSEEEAAEHLRHLSGKSHIVTTGYVLTDGSQTIEDQVETEVTFAPLAEEDIRYYISHCDVMDKAGAYGIQDWIGLSSVARIDGSYSNVIGLPTVEVYRALKTLHYL